MRFEAHASVSGTFSRCNSSTLPICRLQAKSLATLGHQVLRRFFIELYDSQADYQALWREANVVDDVFQVDHTLKVFGHAQVESNPALVKSVT